jgi:hypothetical protein
MGLTQKLGLLAQSVQQDTSLNIGIGGAANASFKLQVTGATNLTGALSGTSATFSGTLGIGTATSPAAELQVGKASDVVIAMSNSSSVTSGNRGGIAWYNSSVSTVANIRAVAVTDNVGTELQFYTRPAAGSLTQVFTLSSTGAATFSSTIGTAGDITITKASAASFIANNTSASGKSFRLVSADDGTFRIQNTGVLDLVTITSTGAATFSSSVTATSNIINGGNLAIKLIPAALGTYGSANYAQWFRADGTTARAFLGFGSGNDQRFQIATIESGASLEFYSGNSAIALTINSSQAATFSSSVLATNNIKIKNNSSNLSYLEFERFSNTQAFSLIEGNGENTTGWLKFYTSDTVRLTIAGNGIVQLGTRTDATESTANLILSNTNYGGYHFLDGTAYYIGQNSAFRSLRIYSGATSAVGVNLAAGGTSWGTYSDERLKENIDNIESVLPRLSTLRTVKYHLKNVDTEDSQKRYGLIAQDLVGKFDEVLNLSKYSDEDTTEYYDVRYTELIPVLVKAIQELEARIKQLENK